ncbi:MAG: hypothetical protein NTW78_04300 [Campylobacterales bacterium]|nr:hypothetical protein [Campylobacterales bacterium]
MSVKKGLIFGFFFAFLVLGVLSMKRAMPEAKEERIYKAIKVYSPYKLEKRMGGLTILNTQAETKETPASADVMHRLDEVEKEWGKSHLQLQENHVIVLGDNNQTVVKIFLENEKEREFLKRFYGI